MKWIYRCIIIGMCAALWFGLWRMATGIEEAAQAAPYRNAFTFPQVLQGTDVYLWSLTADADGTCLVMQNIGEKTISSVEIVFLSYGQRLVFRASEILPGQRVSVFEENNAVFEDPGKLICSEFKVE